MALSQTCTIDDIYALPEGQRAELIDGQLYMMAPPKTIHQRLVSKLGQKIANYIDRKDGDCEVFPAPFAVFLSADEKPMLNRIFPSSVTKAGWTTGAATALLILLSRSSHRPAAGWTTTERTACTWMPVCGNTGLWIPKKNAPPFTAMRRTPLRS